MCEGKSPSAVGEALAAVQAGLAYLNQVAAADLPGVVQADCLRELAKAESAYTAAHARMLGGVQRPAGRMRTMGSRRSGRG